MEWCQAPNTTLQHIPSLTDGIDWLHQHTCHLLILDMDSHEMRQLLALKLINSSFPELNVIAVGCRHSLALRCEAKNMGCVEVLSKPVDTDTLKAALEHFRQGDSLCGSEETIPCLDFTTIGVPV